MEQEEQDGWTLYRPGAHTTRAEVQGPPPQTAEDFKRVSPRHAVIGARPFCSPEYSPDFHKSGSTVRTASHIRPPQPSAKTHVSYLEKKRLRDKQEEIQEVEQLDEWRPAVDILTALLEGLDGR